MQMHTKLSIKFQSNQLPQHRFQIQNQKIFSYIIVVLTICLAIIFVDKIFLQREIELMKTATFVSTSSLISQTFINLSSTGLTSLTLISKSNVTDSVTNLELSQTPLCFFDGNILPQLEEIVIAPTSNNYSITNNKFENLKKLIFNKNQIWNFNANEFPIIQELNLDTVRYFTDNKLRDLTKLNIQYGNKDFSGNYLPKLQELSIYISSESIQLSQQCPHIVKLWIRGNLKNFNETLTELVDLKILSFSLTNFNLNSQSLIKLNLSSNRLTQFNQKRFQMLQILDLKSNSIKNFTANFMPRLEVLNLSENAQVDFYGLLSFGSLKTIDLSATNLSTSLINLNNSNWTSLNLQRCSVKNFYSNNLTSLRELILQNNPIGPLGLFNASSGLPLLQILDLRKCSLTSFIPQSLPMLTKLYLSFNQLAKFINQTMPALRKLTLIFNGLKTFKSNSLPNLQILDLSSNDLDDTIADQLIFMNLGQIQWINLDMNTKIKDPSKVLTKLKSKYPNADISI